MKVLVVDDDKSTLFMIRLLLSRAGCTVAGAMDASQALEIIKAQRFDWLVVDGQLLPYDGFKLASLAKEVQPDIKIVMISGIYGPSDIVGHPIGTIFQKPIDVDQLISHLCH